MFISLIHTFTFFMNNCYASITHPSVLLILFDCLLETLDLNLRKMIGIRMFIK